jgi:hypothetical protein
MRYPNGFFLVLFILFAGVQYNDPDALLWITIYAIPAAWAGVAAFRPGWLRQTLPTAGLGTSLLVSIAGTFYMWPTEAGWWRKDLWWDVELVREGMGLMIVTIGLAVVALTWWLAAPRSSDAASAGST